MDPAKMDESSFLLLLSNLLHLQNYLDPTTTASPLSLSSSFSSPSSLLSSSSAAPLLLFTLASILSYLISSPTHLPSSTTRPTPAKPSSSDNSVSVFRALSTERIWAMEAPLRDAHWRSAYGLSYPVFTTVVENLKPHIALSNLSLPADYAVAMVLSRLAHGASAASIAADYSLEPYLVSKITNMVTRLLATKLYPEFIKIPVGRRRLHEITHAFEELTNLPNMCGAIDGVQIRLHRPKLGFRSVLLQVVADHKKVFWDVCVKAAGGTPDAAHFRDSLLYNRLTMDDLVWDKVMNVRGRAVRPYIVGDQAYPLLSFLFTPFSPGYCSDNAFDSALMKGRSMVVDAIGLLKGRWKILQDLNVDLNHAPQTIVACCVLHNLCQAAREPEPELWREAEESGTPVRVLEEEKSSHYLGESFRQALAEDLHHRISSSSR